MTFEHERTARYRLIVANSMSIQAFGSFGAFELALEILEIEKK